MPFKNPAWFHLNAVTDNCQVVDMVPGEVEGTKGSDAMPVLVE